VARVFTAALALALAGCATAPVPADCTMAPADRAWLEGALANWRRVEPQLLRLPAQPLPTVAAIDGQCTYLLPQGGFAGVHAMRHDGTAVLPDGAEAPLGPISFASGEGGYFAMSLPSVWRAAGVTSELGLERLMEGVLLHEMMHIRQTALAARTLGDAASAAGIADDDLNDDIVQARFEGDPDYVAAWSMERDALFAAAAAPDDAQARQLAAEALALMRARRARWFTGDKASFTAMDDVFLTMEGMGQWLIHKYFLSPEGGGLTPADSLRAVRRNQRWWSQDEGLALILVVDRLLPNWQERAFRDPDWRAERLLAAAIEN
jgi:hypothetical protein